MKNARANYLYILFALGCAVLVLWQLLLPGYILTLDMVFGPHVDTTRPVGTLLNAYPLWHLLSFANLVSSGWVTQKLLLGLVFFLLFYLPLRYFKQIFLLERTYGAEYVAALVFAVNPFIYERFLSGQWLVFVGYVLLVPVLAYALAVVREPKLKNTFKLALSLLLLGVLSIHFLTIAVLLLSVSFGLVLMMKKGSLLFLKQLALLAVVLFVGSSYWLVPALGGTATPLPTFNAEHFEVFKTVGDERIGVVGNILTLHGFWLEREVWADRFVLPKSGGALFYVPASLLGLLILYGFYVGLRTSALRVQTMFLIFILLLSVVFSSGVGDSPLRGVNQFLFDNVSFWKGFRDTQKWSGVIALVYSLYAGLGAYAVLSSHKVARYRVAVLFALASLPLLITPMMLFGFNGQLHTVTYPQSWGEVNALLKEEQDCKVLFLPWHQYYELAFNKDILTSNTAPAYFDCLVVSGKNMELGSIESQGGHGEAYERIEAVVTDNDLLPETAIDFLRREGFTHVIYTDDLLHDDQFFYPFLDSPALEVLLKKEGVLLYRVGLLR